MAPETSGLLAFATWHRQQLEAGNSKSGVARIFGVSPQAVDQWLERRSRPDSDVREIIAAVVPSASSSSWDTDDELRLRAERLERARQAALKGAA